MGEDGNHSNNDCNASGRTILWSSPFWDMDMNVTLGYSIRRNTEGTGIGLEVLESQRGRLLHNRAEIACHSNCTLTLAKRTLNKQNLTTDRSPSETCNHTFARNALSRLTIVYGQSEHLLQLVGTNRNFCLTTLLYLYNTMTNKLGELFLQLTNSALSSILINNIAEYIRRYTECFTIKGIILHYTR